MDGFIVGGCIRIKAGYYKVGLKYCKKICFLQFGLVCGLTPVFPTNELLVGPV